MSREFEYRMDIIDNIGPLEYNFSVDENQPEVYTRRVIIEKTSKKKYSNLTNSPYVLVYEWEPSHTVISYKDDVEQVTDLDIISFGC